MHSLSFPLMGDMCSLQAPRKQLTVATGNILVLGGGHLSASVTYLIATSEASAAVAMATATQHKYQCKAAQPC